MEWRAMDKGQTSIVGSSLPQSVQRAWRSILPEGSLLLEVIHLEEKKTKILSIRKNMTGWLNIILSPCLSEQSNNSMEVDSALEKM